MKKKKKKELSRQYKKQYIHNIEKLCKKIVLFFTYAS